MLYRAQKKECVCQNMLIINSCYMFQLQIIIILRQVTLTIPIIPGIPSFT